MSVIHNDLLLSGDDGYNLTRSLRFRSSASAYLSRTPSSAGNRQTWTHSCWVKRGKISSETDIFSGYASGSDRVFWGFESGDTLQLYASAGAINVQTSAVFRDPSAWYHVFIAFDTTQATSTNRIKIYVNGVQQTTSGTFPNQNTTWAVNNTNAHYHATGTTSTFSDFYLAETNFIDGQALTPSSFGQTSSTTGVWQPKRYTGTYGTNGFYLPFTDNSALTSGSNAGLGKDFSGNGNYWNTNNISITSGATYDSMTDVPTLTSATASNFCVINPLYLRTLRPTISYANLRISTSSAGDSYFAGTMGTGTSGKYYYEMTYTSAGNGILVGATNDASGGSANSGTYRSNTGAIYDLSGTQVATGASYTTNDVIGIAIDITNGTTTFYKNNSSQGSYSFTAGTELFVYGRTNGTGSETADFNFGQRPFAYTPPTGYVALNTYNLPTPTIGATASSQANKYFDVSLYNGNGSSQSITNSGSMQPDFVWVKGRNYAWSHYLYDVIRTAGKALYSNLTNAEATDGGFTSFNSNGFSVGSGALNDNTVPSTYAAWQWKANGTGVTNTAGSITSTVSANTTSGFSVVTYTGNGTGGATVGHGLGVAPRMVIVKRRDSTSDWAVYHASVGNTAILRLNTTASTDANIAWWNNTSPTSTVVTLGSNSGLNGGTQVMYCFSEVAGFSKFGSYTGNGSSDGPMIFTGFKPKYVLIKASSTTGGWNVVDSARSPSNVVDDVLFPNLSDAEGTFNWLDFTSNGFKIRNTLAGSNTSGTTYIYMAFAEVPQKFALGV